MSNQSYPIYKLLSNNDYIKIVDAPSPVNAVAEIEDYLIFSTNNKLYAIDIENKAIKEIAALQNMNDKILSIAYDDANNVLYFSSEKAIFRIQKGEIACVNEEFSGLLQCDELGLVIFNPKEQFVVRLRNNALFPSSSVSTITTKPSIKTNETKTVLSVTGLQTLTFSTPTTLISTSGETFQAQPGDTFEGEMKDGKIITGKVFRNGEPVKMFWDKRNQ